ncbi:MAG TPA: threonine--tRNA ligase [Acidimicrobiales bacterium]|nr:threonine--tRNA ligase [Acidimicrobiales bacterium]
MAAIEITLPDGSQRELPVGTTAADLAASIGSRLAKAAVIAEVNGTERDLATELHDGDTVAIVTGESDRGLFTIRHSTAHVLAQAVLDLFPGATFGIGPPVEDGFYYDFSLPGGATFSPDDLERIEARMREIMAEKQAFLRDEIGADEARRVFADHPLKLEIIDNASTDPMSATESGLVRTYENPPAEPKEPPPFVGYPGFIDLCRGPHVPTTGQHLGHFKLMRVAGAYWRGDERNQQLQRIYGTAWDSRKALEEHLHQLEEAAKRDHRKLGAELDLFSFPDELGSGLVVFHPKGGLVRRLMEDYSRARHEKGGYEFVYSPHISKENLFQTSGHLQWYADGMYPPMRLDEKPGEEEHTGDRYYPKPMNCPFHMLIFRHHQRSYRELPLRLFEFGTVYRYEKSGVVHGLLRARGFTQDDSHIFCTAEQLPGELASLLDFVLELLRDFGFEEFEAELATRPEKFVGDPAEWDEAEAALKSAIEAAGLPYVVAEGEGAFYAPKIDIHIRDGLKRRWQMSTLQVDFQLPERFDLEYVGPDNQRHRPRVIHRALFGSVERFFGVLVEHYAGAFPTWLAPLQVRVLPVRSDHHDYADKLVERFKGEGFRADTIEADEPLGGRIRKAKLEKIPHVLVVGDDDVANDTVGDNPRGGEVERGVPVDELVERLHAEVSSHR